jgi:methanethiol S-methyltransferase
MTDAARPCDPADGRSADRAASGASFPGGGDRLVAVGYGILCHALFGVGVAAMIAAMFHGMSRSLGTVPPPWWPLADAALLAQFPLAHSLLLTPLGGRALKRLAPARIAGRLATTTYVIVASAQVLLLFALWTPSGAVWWRASGPTLWVLCALYAASWLLLLKSIVDAGISVQAGSLGWWSVARGRAPRFPPMPTRGLFRIVRQPIYVSFALTLWTVPTWTPDQLAVALALTAYCLGAPLLKERRFRRRFGAAFDAYAARVPYWTPWPRPLRAEWDRPAGRAAASPPPPR